MQYTTVAMNIISWIFTLVRPFMFWDERHTWACILKYALGSTIPGQLPTLILLESTFLPLRPELLLTKFHLGCSQGHIVTVWLTHGGFPFSFPACSSLWQSLSLSLSGPGNLKPHLCLFFQAIGCWLLFHQLELTWGQVSGLHTDSRFWGPTLNITIYSKRQNLNILCIIFQ